MKKITFFYVLALFTSCCLTACKYETDIPNPGDYVKVYMPQAVDAVAKRTFTMADTMQTIIFGAAFGGPEELGSSVDVTFKVDPSLVDAFNTANGTNYAAMPAGSYLIENTTTTIQAGQVSSTPLKLKVKTKGALDAFKPYLLPVTIDQVSGNFPINENLRTTYFLVESQREGINLKVMSFGKGGGVHNMELAAAIINTHNPDLLLVREMDQNTNRSGKTDQPAVLAELIGMPHYLFIPSIASYDGGAYGSTIYSKYPFKDAVTHILPTGDTNSEKGPLGIVTVQLDEKTEIVFAGTHLNANVNRRTAQLPELVRIMNTYANEPLILAGNFNDRPPVGPVYTSLAEAQFILPCTSCPPNFSAANPTGYSDFVLYKQPNRFRVMDYAVGASSTSSHLPIITQFQVYED